MCFCSLTCVDCASRWHVCIITCHKLHWLARWQTQLLMFSLHSCRCSSSWLTATQKLGLRTTSRPSRRRFLTLDPSTAYLRTTAKASPTLVTTSVCLLTFFLVLFPTWSPFNPSILFHLLTSCPVETMKADDWIFKEKGSMQDVNMNLFSSYLCDTFCQWALPQCALEKVRI